jgi:peptidoglycan/LPS O-acetylase OafA/YrhL
LTYNYADVFRDGVSASTYKEFVLDRLARIYPVHILSMVIVAPIAILSPNHPLDWRALPFHLTLLQCWWPSSNPAFHDYFNVPSWALSCEWFFYVVAPIALYCAFGTKRRWVVLAVVAMYGSALWWLLSTSGEDSVRLHFVSWFAPSRLPEFIAGMLLAQIFMKLPGQKIGEWSALAQVAGISMIIAGAMYRQHAPWPLWGGLLYVPGSVALILGIAGGRGSFVRHLNQPWVKRLGVTSFAFYMIHGPLLRWTKNVFFYFGWEVQSWPSFWGVCITLFMLILLASLIVNSLFEAPLHQRLRTLIRGKGFGEQLWAKPLRRKRAVNRS